MKGYFNFNEAIGYYFRKKDPKRKQNSYLKTMHVINRIALFMFLGGMLFFILKKLI